MGHLGNGALGEGWRVGQARSVVAGGRRVVSVVFLALVFRRRRVLVTAGVGQDGDNRCYAELDRLVLLLFGFLVMLWRLGHVVGRLLVGLGRLWVRRGCRGIDRQMEAWLVDDHLGGVAGAWVEGGSLAGLGKRGDVCAGIGQLPREGGRLGLQGGWAAAVRARVAGVGGAFVGRAVDVTVGRVVVDVDVLGLRGQRELRCQRDKWCRRWRGVGGQLCGRGAGAAPGQGVEHFSAAAKLQSLPLWSGRSPQLPLFAPRPSSSRGRAGGGGTEDGLNVVPVMVAEVLETQKLYLVKRNIVMAVPEPQSLLHWGDRLLRWRDFHNTWLCWRRQPHGEVPRC